MNATTDTARPYAIYVMESDNFWYVGSAWNKTTAEDRHKAHLEGKGKANKLWDAIQSGAQFTQTILDSGYADSLYDAYFAEEGWIAWYMTTDSRECLNVNLTPSNGARNLQSPEINAKRAIASSRPRLDLMHPNPELSERWADPIQNAIWSESIRDGLANAMASLSEDDRTALYERKRATRQATYDAKRAAQTHCPNGHEFTEENTYIRPDNGHRVCRACKNQQMHDWYARGSAPKPKEAKPPKTHCVHGHEWIPENIYVAPNGHESCRICTRETNRQKRLQRSAEKKAMLLLTETGA